MIILITRLAVSPACVYINVALWKHHGHILQSAIIVSGSQASTRIYQCGSMETSWAYPTKCSYCVKGACEISVILIVMQLPD